MNLAGISVVVRAQLPSKIAEKWPVTIGFWVAPQENWDASLGDKEITLLDMRGDASVTGSQVDGTDGDPDKQNNMRLWFDAKHEHLVLSLHGPAIERSVTAASTFTRDQDVTIGSDDPPPCAGTNAALAAWPAVSSGR